MDNTHDRDAFENEVFKRRYIASIKRNPDPPKGTGAFDFISQDCPTKAELCAKGEAGDYVDRDLSAMWYGWQMAYEHLNRESKPA